MKGSVTQVYVSWLFRDMNRVDIVENIQSVKHYGDVSYAITDVTD